MLFCASAIRWLARAVGFGIDLVLKIALLILGAWTRGPLVQPVVQIVNCCLSTLHERQAKTQSDKHASSEPTNLFGKILFVGEP